MGKLFFFLLALFFAPTYAIQKSYIVYLGAHSLESPHAVNHELRRDSHYELLSSFLGSKENAKDAIFYSYTNHINGFAARLEEQHAAAIAKHPSVLSVFPNRGRFLHTTRTWEFMELEKDGNLLTGSAWDKANYGEDVIIANLDTGVWPESKSFSDEGFGPVPARWKGVCQNETDVNGVKCNRKLIGARYFDKGYIEYVHHPDTKGFISPRDHDGHGSHTLSTAGGSFVHNASIFGHVFGTAKGGSPRARVATYKVCWTPVGDDGECFDADILAALDAAIADGVDVISMSLGGDPIDYFYDSVAIGSFHAVSRGITVVASAGNSGPTASTVSNIAPWIFTVGASTFDREFVAYVTLGDNITLTGESIASDSLAKKFYPLVSGEDVKISNATAAALCIEGSLDPVKTEGKIVACLRGSNARVAKGYEVWKAGGAGMILCNDPESGNELIADAHFLPASHLTAADGQKLFAYINSTKSAVAYISPPSTRLGKKPSPVMAAFSSQGPNSITPEILKPDITAPGVNVLAAYSLAVPPTGLQLDKRRVPFYIDSGTSMSCPHVSGVVGLLRKVHPDWSPAAIKSAIMTTARRRDNIEEPILNASLVKATPFSYGAGHVQPNRATDPGLVYDIGVDDYLNFFCAIGYNKTLVAVITNQTYECPSKKPKVGDINYPSISFIDLTGKDTVSRTVKNVGTPGTYKVRIQSPPGVLISVEPKSLKFDAVGEEKKFTVTAEVKKGARDGYVFGRMIWFDGKHYVRSAIVVKVGSS